MMIRIKKFYIDPSAIGKKKFEPIKFEEGINLIIGEKSDEELGENQHKKMNSVGKSLLIEMINFCLLVESAKSRVDRIPLNLISDSTRLNLELEYEDGKEVSKITIRRSRSEREPIIIEVDGEVSEFAENKIDSAREYLSHYFLKSEVVEKPSFRQLLSILIRDEKSGFDNILHPNKNSPTYGYTGLILPHVYLFGFSVEPFKEVEKVRNEIKKANTVIADARNKIKSEGVQLKEVRSYINNLESEVKKLDIAENELKPSEGSIMLANQLNELNANLEEIISIKTSKEMRAKRIKALTNKSDQLDLKKLNLVYEKYRSGLGDLVSKTFEETLDFRKQIEEFENELKTNKLSSLNNEIRSLDLKIEEIDNQISDIYKKVGYAKTLSDFRITVQQHRESHEKLEKLKGEYKRYEDKNSHKKRLQLQKQQYINKLEVQLFEFTKNIKKFEKNLVSIHEYIYGNASCHFEVNIDGNSSSAKYLTFDYRTELDGGASSDRMKTFIYDTLLMLNEQTSERHPGFLIHDNVFAAVGRNDMVSALNYLNEQKLRGKKYQYIVTLNKDEFEAHEDEFNFETSEVKRVELTRQDPLLGTKYTEIDI